MDDGSAGLPRGMVVAAVAVVVIVLLAVAAVVVMISSPIATSSGTSSLTSSSTSSHSTASHATTTERASLHVPVVYAALGYPKVTYSDYFPYSPSKPNFTVEYQTKNTNFQLGSIRNVSVMGLDQAVRLAIARFNLTVPLQLGYATFYPGTIVNSTLTIHPMWYLFLAAEYDGFWAWGSYGNGAFSAEANVDALNGTIRATNIGVDLSNLPTSGHYGLDVNSSLALETVRTEGSSSSIPNVPPALAEYGNVSSIEPRFVLLGPGSRNAAFQNPVNTSLSGQIRLCWIIQLHSPTPGPAGYQGTFAVDAQTGELVSGWAQELFPGMHIETVDASLDMSRTSNLTVSQETFQIDGSVVGRPGTVPVSVPSVLIAEPGSSSRIYLNFTSSFPDRTINISLQSFSNPLPVFQNLSSSGDGLPPGVSARFLTSSVPVPADGTSVAAVSISVGETAPAGTYLLKLNAAWSSPAGGMSSVLFLLTIWNGSGRWPPPPTIG